MIGWWMVKETILVKGGEYWRIVGDGKVGRRETNEVRP